MIELPVSIAHHQRPSCHRSIFWGTSSFPAIISLSHHIIALAARSRSDFDACSETLHKMLLVLFFMTLINNNSSFRIKMWDKVRHSEIYACPCQSNSAAVNGEAFPHTFWSNGSSLIDFSCLSKSHRDHPVPLSNTSLHTDFSLSGKMQFLPLRLFQSSVSNMQHLFLTISSVCSTPHTFAFLYLLLALLFMGGLVRTGLNRAI